MDPPGADKLRPSARASLTSLPHPSAAPTHSDAQDQESGLSTESGTASSNPSCAPHTSEESMSKIVLLFVFRKRSMEPTLGSDWEWSTRRAATHPSLHMHCRRWGGRQRLSPTPQALGKKQASLRASAGSWVIITLITHT